MDEVGPLNNLASADQVSSIGTPKKTNMAGPRFDESEFGPQAPVVQESALVSHVNRHKKQMTRAEYAKMLRESKRA